MKPLALALLLLFAFPQVELKRSYDKFKDETTIHVPVQYVEMASPGQLEATAYVAYKGKGEDPIIGLAFYSSSRSWRFIDNSYLIALVDGERIEFGDPIAKDRKLARTSGVEESLGYKLTFEQLSRLADANSVEMQIGRVEFKLRPKFIEGLKSLKAAFTQEVR